MNGPTLEQQETLKAEANRRLLVYDAMAEFVSGYENGVDREMDDDHSRGWSDGSDDVIEKMKAILRRGLPSEVESLQVGDVVYAEVFDPKAAGYVTARGIVKGKWQIGPQPSDRYPWYVAVELSKGSNVAPGFSFYEAGDVVPIGTNLVSRTRPNLETLSTGSDFTQTHIALLPDVRLHHRRIVPRGEPMPDGS